LAAGPEGGIRLSRTGTVKDKGSQVQLIHSLKSRRDAEEGFTLIELMVVVLIIAILIAIAIPTFLGARSRAQNRAAQSDLRNGLTAEKTFFTDNETYSKLVADMQGIEPSLHWGTDLTFNTSADKKTVCLSEASKSGTTYSVADISSDPTVTPGTYYASAACPGTVTAAAVSGAGWSQTAW